MNAGRSSLMLAHLVEPAARSLALAMLAGAGLALLRIRVASLKFMVWRAVLAAALAMPLVEWLVPGLPVILPRPAPAEAALASLLVTRMSSPGPELLKPAFEEARNRYLPELNRRGQPAILYKSDAGNERETAHGTVIKVLARQIMPTHPRPKRPFPWGALATFIYFFGAAALVARLAVGWVFSRKLARSSEKVRDPRLFALFAEQAASFGLRRLVSLTTSGAVAVPVTIGALAPCIVLPANSAAWDERKCRAVFAHELSHVARRDALTFWFSSLYRSLFWFSPLAWWLDHKLTALAEQASDEWALERVKDRIYYAELLLGFWRDLNGAPRRVRWEGVSMARRIRINERLEGILNARVPFSKGIRKPVTLAMGLAAVPVLYLAAAVRPAVAPQAPAPPAPAVVAPTAPVAPAPAPAPVKPTAGVYRVGPTPQPPVAAAPAPMGPPALAAVPAPPQVAKTPEPPNEEDNGFVVGEDDEGEHFVIVWGDSTTMSGSSDDARLAKALRRKISGDYIWFHRDDKEYVIRDKATVERAKALFAPQQELGRKQEALGKMQEELGAQQEALGKQMEEIRVKLPDLRKEVKKLEEEVSDIESPIRQEKLAELQAELADMQSRIAEAQARVGEAQGEIGRKQGELGRRQGELGREQGELGREQGRLAREGNRKMKDLLDDALGRGLAQPAPN